MTPVISVAIKSEFSPIIDIPILYTGIGKINATYKLTNYLKDNPLVDTVINVGTAGGVYPEQKHQVIECGIFADGELEYPGYQKRSICNWRSITKICTFDKFQTKRPDDICHVVDMEAFALASVCQELGIKFFCFKYITDIVEETNQENDWVYSHGNGQDLLLEKVNKLIIYGE